MFSPLKLVSLGSVGLYAGWLLSAVVPSVASLVVFAHV